MNQIHLQSANGNLAAVFPSLVRLCLKQTARGDHERQMKILTRRHGLDGAPINTLEELGEVYDVSRQRISQLQVKAESRIRQLLEDSLKRRAWDICPSLRSAYADLKDDFAAAGPALSRSRFQSVVRKRFGNAVKGHWFSLFAQTLDYRQLAPSAKVPVAELSELWVPQGLAPQGSIDQVFRTLNALRKSPEGTPLTTLLAELRSAGHAYIDEPLLRVIISALPRLQITRSEQVRIRTECLTGASDQAWRVLKKHGKPLHRDEIARRVNALRVGRGQMDPCTTENIANQMCADPRFVCSGKSGFWGLKEWGTVSESTIVEAMEVALHAAGQPLTMNALIRATLRLRPDASPKSVKSYVGQRPEQFVRAGRGKVALAKWKIDLTDSTQRGKVRCSSDDFIAAVELVRDDREALPLKELIDGVAELTGQAEPTVRLRISDLKGIHIKDMSGQRGKRIHFTCNQIRAPEAAAPTKRQLIQSSIRSILSERPAKYRRKADLHEQVSRQIPCCRPTFYAYLREMNLDSKTFSQRGERA